MTRIHATFDGQVLKPEEPFALVTNRRYLLTVEEDESTTGDNANTPYPLAALAAQAIDLGVSDMAERHHDYARRRPGPGI